MKGGWFRKIVNSKSKTFLAFCFCFIAGAAAGSVAAYAGNIAFYIYLLMLLLILPIIIWRGPAEIRFRLIGFFIFIFGFWRALIYLPDCGNSGNLCFFNNEKEKVTGYVAEEPDIGISSAKYTVNAETANGRKVSGAVLLNMPLYPQASSQSHPIFFKAMLILD